MSNPLYEMMNGGKNNNMMQQIQNLKKQFSDPKQAVMQMLTNGQINQAQINQAMQMAQQFKGFKF